MGGSGSKRYLGKEATKARQYTCMYIYICVYCIHKKNHNEKDKNIIIHIYIHIHIYIYIYMHTHMHVWLYVYVMYIKHVCIRICIQ